MKTSQTIAQMEAKLAIYEQIRDLLNERETEDPQLSELLGELDQLTDGDLICTEEMPTVSKGGAQ